MRTKLIVLTLVVAITVVFLGFAQFSYAQQNTPLIKQKIQQQKTNIQREMMEKRLEDGPAAKMRELIESLNLSEEQKTEIRKIDLDFQKEKLGLKSKLEINQLEIKSLFLEKDPDLVKIRAKLQEVADLQTELKMKDIEEYLAVKGILTSEQQEKLPEGIPFQIFALEKLRGMVRMLGNLGW